MSDLAKLRALCAKATPGPWRWGDWTATFGTFEDPDQMTRLEHNPAHPTTVGPVRRERDDGTRGVLEVEEPPSGPNAEYIAALSPDVVIPLLDKLIRYEEALRKIAAWDGDPSDTNAILDIVDDANHALKPATPTPASGEGDA